LEKLVRDSSLFEASRAASMMSVGAEHGVGEEMLLRPAAVARTL